METGSWDLVIEGWWDKYVIITTGCNNYVQIDHVYHYKYCVRIWHTWAILKAGELQEHLHKKETWLWLWLFCIDTKFCFGLWYFFYYSICNKLFLVFCYVWVRVALFDFTYRYVTVNMIHGILCCSSSSLSFFEDCTVVQCHSTVCGRNSISFMKLFVWELLGETPSTGIIKIRAVLQVHIMVPDLTILVSLGSNFWYKEH